MSYANQTAAVDRPSNPSLFGTAADTRRIVQEAADNVCSMIDRLCGQEPPSPEKNGAEIRGVPTGLLDEGLSDLALIRAQCERIDRALGRLNNKLP